MRKIETYTVRNEQGQLIGRYRAISAESAIRAAKNEQLVMRGWASAGEAGYIWMDIYGRTWWEPRRKPLWFWSEE